MSKYYSMIFSSGWFLRGGENNYGNKAGVFQFEYWNGNQYNSCGARAVLLLLDYNIVPKGNFSIYKFKDLYHK